MLDRNLNELLQELRVAQTGVQILFAFLLTLPFNARFDGTTEVQRVAYVVTLLLSAAATGTLIAPVAFHRLVFRRGKREELVRVANTLAVVGLGLLLLAVSGAVFLVVDVVVGGTGAVLLAGGAAAWFLVLWVLLPLRARHR
ncbi:amine oxidase [Vallicoccus soli]|uniref:Amine oxidase n=1 Tax=Vallicoccus soli TaxID=2339232 RepID=A0A3A3YXS8_9ACTN|nr:amine oxidase [Vallicoccus soli]